MVSNKRSRFTVAPSEGDTSFLIGHRWKGLFTVEENVAGGEFGITLRTGYIEKYQKNEGFVKKRKSFDGIESI